MNNVTSDYGLEGNDAVQTYFRQVEAIEDAYKSSGTPKTVFSFEIDLSGSRKFLVTTKEKFYSFYSQLKQQRHYYEVIPEMSKSKLYFDLEFVKHFNKEKNGHFMTRKFISKVNECLYNKYKIRNNFEDVVILESSSVKKFSLHLIFKEVVFPNNRQCGRFVKKMTEGFSTEEMKMFEINESSGHKGLYIDETVYSKNRHFRIILSSKIGRAVPLLLSSIDTCAKKMQFSTMKSEEFDIDYDIFMSSLVTFTSDSKYQVMEHEQDDIITMDSSSHVDPIEGQGSSSPFPEVEDYIKTLIPRGTISRWKYYTETESYGFDTVGDRYCRNVQRRHRRNNTFYVLKLSDGGVLRQGCHKCFGYYSDPIPLPRNLLDWFQNMEDF